MGRSVWMWAQPTLAVCLAFQLPLACGGSQSDPDESCKTGSRNCACYRDDSCDAGLRCRSELCVSDTAGDTGGRANSEGGTSPGDAGESSSNGGSPVSGGASAANGGSAGVASE